MASTDYFGPIEVVVPSVTESNGTSPSIASIPTGAGSTASLRSSQKLSMREEIKFEVILNHLFQKQCSKLWIDDISGAVEGTIVRIRRNEYLCCPPAMQGSPFTRAMCALNVQAAMTVKSRVISTFLAWSPGAYEIPIRPGLRIQVVTTIDDLARARKHHYAAFVASQSLLVVWDDEPAHLLKRVESIEEDLLNMVWLKAGDDSEKMALNKDPFFISEKEISLEEEEAAVEERPVEYYSAILTALSVCLVLSLSGLGYQNIAAEVSLLHDYTSIALVAMTPVNFVLALFFTSVVITAIAQMFGPVKHLERNSRYYSALPPRRIYGRKLPHVTVQCPVYKEGLEGVIRPTMTSIKQAISTYELQGGSANILVNDDGMQIIDAEERNARIEFYSDNDIGWTARPKHGDNFIRKGKFKKASNMNYGLALSNLVEDRLQKVERGPGWTQEDETKVYDDALQQVLLNDGRAWAQGNIRVGDYILLIDSDTRVPEDCLLDAVSEMEQAPDVAIIQFSCGVMQVAHDFFENGITFFTNMIYTAIKFGVGSGDVAPFVGHNAILRWSAIQECAFIDDEGNERFWSEVSVSEDFDMALRLQVEGYIIRFAAWAGDGFKEGVSLTIYDELTRWEKYAYGCSELVFNPIKNWPLHGPITPLFRRFCSSCLPLGSKLNIIAYIGTYYAIGSAWLLTLVNYVAVGLYNGYLDKWYLESWKVWVSIVVVFSFAGNVSLAVQRYRLGVKSFISSLLENFQWTFMFVIMFGGMSLHVSQALLSHMFSIDMQWGATGKEYTKTNFFMEVPKVMKKFKYSLAGCLLMIIGMIIMAKAPFIPWSWNITEFVAIFPLAVMCVSHILLPIALNPGLMTFTW